MKRSFTLVEMIISITLFSIVLVFLYKALDITKLSNQFYNKKLIQFEAKSDIKKLIFTDILNKDNNITMKIDKNKNTILQFNSSNTYHNPFYTNITYLISKNNNLLRLESKNKFNKNKIYNFIDNSYIDIVDYNISKFKIAKNKTDNKSYVLYIKYNNNEQIYLPF